MNIKGAYNVKEQNNMNPEMIMKKIRIMVLDNIIAFINKVIRLVYNDNIGKNIFIKQFLSIDKSKLSHSTVEFDKEFLNKKLNEILSEKISLKYTSYPEDKNKVLVEHLSNDSGQIGEFFKQLFNLTFSDCLKHVNGKENLDILNGLLKMDEMLVSQSIESDEIDIYKSFFENYENFVMNKKPRKTKKQQAKINN